jgi:ABC-type branched-subunit amino acid transport system substrate-binding protein
MVAFLGPLSGEYEAIGSRAWASVSMATTQMGVARAEMFDTADDPAGAYALARAAGAIAILGPIGELESRVVSEAADPDGPPVFLLTSVQGLESGRPHVFRMRTSAADQAEALLAYHLATGEMSSFAILAPDDSYGEEAVLAAIRSVPEFGGVVDRVVRYETDDPDASDAVAQLVGQRAQRLAVPANPWRTPPSISIRSSGGDRSRPDAVFIPDFAPQVASILPHLAFHEWLDTGGEGRVRLLGLSGWASVALEAVGDLAATARVTQIFSVEDFRGLSESFSLEYQVRFGDEPTEFDAQVFDAASFVLSMLAARPDSLQRAVLEFDSFGGICGDAWFDAEGGLVRTIGLWEVDGVGQLYPIDVIRPPREGALR